MTFWSGKKVLITGHTGFKGSWLCLWLQKLGAEVIGYALEAPTVPNLFKVAGVQENMTSIVADVRNKERLFNVIKTYKPEIIFHLAAQPLVRKSYANPVETFETNIMGTVNLLEAIRFSESVKVVVNITSDKCYDNKEWSWGYREIDAMGGYDPYSCSKGCSELITNSFRKSYFNEKNIQLASVRAGNVIGGGDWAEDRLVPDIIKYLIKSESVSIRNPFAIRPWQHVLEPLNGYMMLAETMWQNGEKYSEAWNFGPDDDHVITVGELTDKLTKLWKGNLEIKKDNRKQPHEATLLKLDCSKAKLRLGWHPKLNLEDTLIWTVNWYKEFVANRNAMKEVTLKQIEAYERLRRN
ncbi:CDP-glucose 4,6-dehydratase [Clostridium estertheticum]|uniref:CDP-glucose 4,6-dehydratase n=1 Tax=Clostridium estertheticum TaxID=238834 RepID=UPI00124CD155|nr:CDP-glucose 4,6-dehydratase [Clostridium estertheticum]MBU3170209.1 CDP-glucose 4,6-dehydratase [Clostridium estertheticum]MBZ9617011.1 CDP-glucose 4,6-dehydratase [Clostridium estertheticum subsp. laramiense]WAG72712.1 CDP-glucose 4,6-dehydratase [Clostridium estertheticum]